MTGVREEKVPMREERDRQEISEVKEILASLGEEAGGLTEEVDEVTGLLGKYEEGNNRPMKLPTNGG